MPVPPLIDLSRLCLHSATTRVWPLATAARKYGAAGIKGITIGRNAVEAYADGFKSAGHLCREEGLQVVSYIPGATFTGLDAGARQAAIDDSKRRIDEAAALGAPLLVLACGATPGQSLFASRSQIADGLRAVLPHARGCGVKLSIEPLHPMYADSGSAMNSMRQATDLAVGLDDDHLGVTLDVYHVWWDDRLKAEIGRCGREKKLFSFHICDWRNQPADLRNDRGLMGEGVIAVPEIRSWVDAVGFTGFHEVEILSDRYAAMDPDDFLKLVIEAYRTKA